MTQEEYFEEMAAQQRLHHKMLEGYLDRVLSAFEEFLQDGQPEPEPPKRFEICVSDIDRDTLVNSPDEDGWRLTQIEILSDGRVTGSFMREVFDG